MLPCLRGVKARQACAEGRRIIQQEIEKRISREDATLSEFGAHIEPALPADPGERLVVEILVGVEFREEYL